MQNINEIDDLIKLISKLPGLGPKSAKRIVLKLINNKEHQNRIATIINWDPRKLQKIISAKKNRKGIPLTRKLTKEQKETLSDLRIDGVYFTEYSKRHYPTSNVAAHLIGFTDRDDRGQEGIEKLYDTTLQGAAGQRRVLQDARRQVVKSLEIIKSVELN